MTITTRLYLVDGRREFERIAMLRCWVAKKERESRRNATVLARRILSILRFHLVRGCPWFRSGRCRRSLDLGEQSESRLGRSLIRRSRNRSDLLLVRRRWGEVE